MSQINKMSNYKHLKDLDVQFAWNKLEIAINAACFIAFTISIKNVLISGF
jgi:hypothetical protein